MSLKTDIKCMKRFWLILFSVGLLSLAASCGSLLEKPLTDREIVNLNQTTKQAWRLQSERVGRIQGVEPVLPVVAPPDLEAMFSADYVPTGYDIAFQQANANFVICESLPSCGPGDEVLQTLEIDGQPIKVIYLDIAKWKSDPVQLDEIKDFWRTVELERGIPDWMKEDEE